MYKLDTQDREGHGMCKYVVFTSQLPQEPLNLSAPFDAPDLAARNVECYLGLLQINITACISQST